jgi:ribonuclease HI
MTNATGDLIRLEFRDRRLVSTYTSHTPMQWPSQLAPALSTYGIWLAGLKSAARMRDNGELRYPLGSWLGNPYLFQHHLHHLSINQDTLLVYDNDISLRWYRLLDHTSHHLIFQFQDHIVSTEFHSAEFYPCDILPVSDLVYVRHRSLVTCKLFISPSLPVPTIGTLQHQFSSSTGWPSPLFKHTLVLYEPRPLELSSHIHMSCDAGVTATRSGIGVVIANYSTIIATNQVAISPSFSPMTPYRCEGYGILAALHMFSSFTNYYSSGIHKLTLYSDSESMVNMINKFRIVPFTKKFFYEADVDLIYSIIKLIISLEGNHFQIMLCFVKGHQDQQQLPLTFPAYLNQQADYHATQSLLLRRIYSINDPTLPATISINNLRVTSKYSHHIKTTFHSMDLRQHMQTANHWTSVILDDIWWDVHDKVLKKFPISQRMSLIKFLHKLWPCNHREGVYYEYRNSSCVFCQDVVETQDHVLCCPCPKREVLRMKYLSNLRVLLKHMKTNDDIITVLLHYLSTWLSGNMPLTVNELLPNPSDAMITAVVAQSAIGWGQFFKGRMSIQWAYLFNHDPTRPLLQVVNPFVDKWGTSIIKLSMEFVLTAWEIRNDIEHDVDGDPLMAQKKKLVQKILWFISQIPSHIIPEYEDLYFEDLIYLPLPNLLHLEAILHPRLWRPSLP